MVHTNMLEPKTAHILKIGQVGVQCEAALVAQALSLYLQLG